MTIHEIENLTADELKARHEELLEALEDVSFSEVAGRYLQARTDAKRRDVTLGEQGKTITALRDALNAAKQQAENAEDVSRAVRADLVAARAERDEARTAVAEATAALTKEIARANRLKAIATRNQTALTGAHKTLADALAVQEIDDADTGK